MINRLTELLKASNEGRCSNFIYGFGYKDADLEPEGCTGITKILAADEDNVLIEVGGHKSIGDPAGWWIDSPEGVDEALWDEFIEFVSEVACETIQSAALHNDNTGVRWEWDGDDAWDSSFTMAIQVPWVYHPNDGGEDFHGTVAAISNAAQEYCDYVSKQWAETDEAIDLIYKETDNGELWTAWLKWRNSLETTDEV